MMTLIQVQCVICKYIVIVGNFMYRFSYPGTYYYVAEDVIPNNNHKMRGIVTVLEKRPVFHALDIDINGAKAKHNRK